MNTNEDETIELAERSIKNGVRQGTRGRYTDAIKTFDQAVMACLKFKGDSDAVRLRPGTQGVELRGPPGAGPGTHRFPDARRVDRQRLYHLLRHRQLP